MITIQRIFSLLLCLLLSACSTQPVSVDSDGAGYTVLTNVNVVDVISGTLLSEQTVVIKDSLIHYVGRDWKAAGKKVVETIDGHDQYLIPGLWDMHFHLAWEESNEDLLFQLLLHHGITGVRDMGGDLTIQRKMKRAIAADPAHGPTLFGAGPILDGNPPVVYDFSIVMDDDTNVAYVLDSLMNAGSDFFKTYSLLREPILQQVADFSREHNYTFAGHLSEYIEPERSIALGQKSIEHLNRLDDIWEHDTARIARIAELMKENNTWLCPTLIIYALKNQMRDSSIFYPVYDRYVHPVLEQEWQTSRTRRLAKMKPLDWQAQSRLFDQQKELLAFLYQHGVLILAGSDFGGMPYVYPGLGLWQELELLHDAGLTNAAIVASATINPARFMGVQDRYGSIEPGKYADLVMLTANPLKDIRSIREIAAVFRKGKRVQSE